MYSSRPYSGSQDLQLMTALIETARPPEQRADYPNRTDLYELMQSPTVQANTRLWLDGESPAGFALVDEFDNLRFDAAPADLDALGDLFVRWGVECAARSGARTLDAVCRATDAAMTAFLEDHGFTKSGPETLSLQRDLRKPIRAAEVPAGFAIRSARGEEEAAALAELHRAAFETGYMTTEKRLAIMQTPAYDPELDLVAVAPDGRLAAYCICYVNEAGEGHAGPREGQTDPVGTRPCFQHLGLARALLCTGLRLLKERGMDFANLGTSSENIPMQKAAESVGFVVRYRKIWFEKEIS
jgi:ribosomal protein S18 acetylase RimI-like enzyme